MPFKKKRYLILSLLIVVIGLAITLFMVRTEQDVRSQAADTPKLRWSPPKLTNPTTIYITETGPTTTKMDPNKDYIIKLPNKKKSGMTRLDGGRNVVVIGGHLTVAPNLPVCYHPNCTHERNRAIFISGATGTVHLEGILIDSSSGSQMDAIIISAPKATVQVQNVRINNLRGTYKEYHADMIQPWGGVAELRIDRLTGDTNYQGFYFVYSSIKKVIMQNVNIKHNGGEGKLMYMSGTSGCGSHPGSISFTNVYFQPRSGRSLPSEVVPDSRSSCKPTFSNNVLSFPSASWVTGNITQGAPATDFVPEGLAGLSYVSPGYTDGTVAPTSNPTAAPTRTPTPTARPGTITPTRTLTPPKPSPTATRVPSTTKSPRLTPEPTTMVPTSTTMPTNASDPSSTNLSLQLFLQGIGKGGDNVTPRGTGNPAPVHPQRTVDVTVMNEQNVPMYQGSGIITYNSAAGNFTGTVAIGTIKTGSYTVTVTVDGFLTRLLPGIQRLSGNSMNSLPQATLITGDINHDNKLNILDYSVLVTCYTEHTPCSGEHLSPDLNDDGHVDLIDYNLFIRNMSVVNGADMGR